MNCFAWGPNQRISVQPAIPKPPRPLGAQTALPRATVRRVRDLPALQPEHRPHSPNLPNLTSVSRSATWVNLTVTRASRAVSSAPKLLPFQVVILAQPESPYWLLLLPLSVPAVTPPPFATWKVHAHSVESRRRPRHARPPCDTALWNRVEAIARSVCSR